MRTVHTTLGGLTCHVVEEPGTRPDLAVILCHGFGATGDDLAPFAAEIAARLPAVRGRVRFVFPEAPLTLGDLGYGTSRAWWMIDLQSIAARRAGDGEALRRYRQETPEGLGHARRLLRGAVDQLLGETGLGFGQVVLGGFSQGSMLTLDLALRLDEPPAALWALSGTLIAEPEWRRLAPRRKGLHVVQSHGTLDPILPFENAVALRDLLIESGLEVDFLSFPGEHTIPPTALDKLIGSLTGLLAAK
ncbi:alpha/beta hydrolase [Vulgatibacter sp.]|uniref:alpha/beta hydrolase n=1 Tax=Vulgatibacter sp. TaxID=1971226 RepID=UPI0035699BA0